MSKDGGQVDYKGIKSSPLFESYCQLADSLRETSLPGKGGGKVQYGKHVTEMYFRVCVNMALNLGVSSPQSENS
jgi:hypothetical protein